MSYEDSHPWISFKLDLNSANYLFWMQLGEANSKCMHIFGTPLPSPISENLHKMYLAKGVLATTAIEGNSLSQSQVLEHIEGKLKLPPSKEYLRQEVENILNACNLIGQELIDLKTYDVTFELILCFNTLVLDKLPVDQEVRPGIIREYSVGVGNYLAAPATDCKYLLEQLVDWLKNFDEVKLPGYSTTIIKAVLVHLYIAWIHPFGDGNGRTARLLEFYILCSAGIPSAAAHLLSNHYNETRSQYYRKLDEARQNPMAFIDYAIEGFVDGLREQIKIIRDYQWDLTWQDYVNNLFKDKNRISDKRRLHLLTDLAQNKDYVKLSDLTLISPRVAVDYAGKSQKTLTRDLEYLLDHKLIEIKELTVRAKREIVLAFLPFLKTNDLLEKAELKPLIIDRLIVK